MSKIPAMHNLVATYFQVFDLQKLKVFVLDEADVMIATQGFRDHSIRIHKLCPSSCQFLLFSATYDEPVIKFAQQIVQNPNVIRVRETAYFAALCYTVLHWFLKLFTQYVVRGDYWVPAYCSLTVDSGVASLIAWLDHSWQKSEVGGKQEHAPCRKILLQQIPMTRKKTNGPRPQQLLNRQGVQRISGFKPESHGIRFSTLNVGSVCTRKTEELRKRRLDVCCMLEVS